MLHATISLSIYRQLMRAYNVGIVKKIYRKGCVSLCCSVKELYIWLVILMPHDLFQHKIQ